MSELKEKILQCDNALIISHMNPDPDTVGSALGLKYIFEKLGKTAFAACETLLNERMCGFFKVKPALDREYTESINFVPDCVICVDTATPQLLGKYESKYYSPDSTKNKIYMTIDHHYTNQLYGKYNYVDDTACAAGQIIFDIAKAFEIEIDKKFASDIYCAIVSDSGSFKYSSTTPKTHNIAAELISTGFDFAKLNRLIYDNKSLTQIGIEKLGYNALKIYCGGKVASIVITSELKKNAGLEGAEVEGISEIAKGIAGVEVGYVMKEIDDADSEKGGGFKSGNEGYISEFKVSLRSNSYINVAEVAAEFDGGGHPRAAGCKIRGNAYEVEQRLLDRIDRAFSETVISDSTEHGE